MKRFFAAFLLFTYCLVSTGFAVRTHYCMGNWEGVDLCFVQQDPCSNCGMDAAGNEGCCRDEIKVVKLQQDLLTAKQAVPVFEVPVAVLPFTVQQVAYITSETGCKIKAGPPGNSPPVYLTNCVFRI